MITDVDKLSHDRGKPSPNSHDQLLHSSLMAKGTNSVNYISAATNTQTQDPAKNGQFTIVQSGEFTTTVDFNTSGTLNSYQSSNQLVYQVPHNLPFTPSLTAMMLTGGGTGYTPMPFTFYTTANSGADALWYTWRITVDAVNLTISLSTMNFNTVSGGWSLLPGFGFKWFLQYQTSN